MGKRQMPKFSKAPAELVARFSELAARIPDVDTRTMFGYPAAFVNGQMFSCVFGSSVMLRLSESDRAEFLATYNTKLFEPMPGKPMREYAEIPPALLGKASAVAPWLERSAAFARSLPPKKKR